MAKTQKEIAIIGAGFTGLAAAIALQESGYIVTIFEQTEKPGGLAAGFRLPQWQWPLEDHYHHIFTSDTDIINFAKKIGVPLIEKRPISATYYQGKRYQLDSPSSLLTFTPLPLIDRLRMGATLAFFRTTPFWQPLETLTAATLLRKTMGQKAWKVVWEPLFVGKFGDYAETIPASWFWARIKKRSASLLYPEGGFLSLATAAADYFTIRGGAIRYTTQITAIKKVKNGVVVSFAGEKDYTFDRVISTLPFSVLEKLVPALPKQYREKFHNYKGLGAVNLILQLKKPFFPDNTYWLNVNDMNMPFLCLVEHTNFMQPDRYHNDHLLYIGAYLPNHHVAFTKSAQELFAEYYPSLKAINPSFTKGQVKDMVVKKAAFAQPLPTLRFSKQLLPFQTPLAKLYVANMQQVYPWDRGTNYAVALGQAVARTIILSRDT